MISRKILTICLYITFCLSIFVFQPAVMFDNDGNIKCFEYDTEDNNNSLLSIVVLLPFIALLCYFAILLLELICT